jgi:cold shock CspA family protein
MRTHGTLTKWNDHRGFGFITPADGASDIFVHISEFPRTDGRPAINELISFEVVPGADGKQRAVRVMRPGQKSMRPPATHAQQQPQSRWLLRALTLLVVAALGANGYLQYTQRPAPADDLMPKEAFHLAAPASRYSCDGRTMCSQMHSCEEATYFIRNCPNTQMDGDSDGVPCESQWCD